MSCKTDGKEGTKEFDPIHERLKYQWHTLYLLSVSMFSILIGDRNLTDDDKKKWLRLYCLKFYNQRRHVWSRFARQSRSLGIFNSKPSQLWLISVARDYKRGHTGYRNPWTFLFLWITANMQLSNPIFTTSLCYKVGTERNIRWKHPPWPKAALIKVRRILVIRVALTLIEFLDNIN